MTPAPALYYIAARTITTDRHFYCCYKQYHIEVHAISPRILKKNAYIHVEVMPVI